MNTKDQIAIKINDFLKDAFSYQLAKSGKYVISNNTAETTINNEIFNEFSLKFISSSRLDFDGGIEIQLLAIDDIGISMLELLEDNTISVNIYNLESTDGEYDLEKYEINRHIDCERVSTSLNFNKVTDKNVELFNDVIEAHINSIKIGSLKTYTALKDIY